MNIEKASSGGIGFCSALFLLFLGLKLGNVIDWSWWWVFAPVWIPILLFVVVIGIVFIVLVATGKGDKK